MLDPENSRIDDQVAVIRGAGAGIDRAIAETFGAVGAAVIVSDRDVKAAASEVEAIVKGGGQAVIARRQQVHHEH